MKVDAAKKHTIAYQQEIIELAHPGVFDECFNFVASRVASINNQPIEIAPGVRFKGLPAAQVLRIDSLRRAAIAELTGTIQPSPRIAEDFWISEMVRYTVLALWKKLKMGEAAEKSIDLPNNLLDEI